MGENATLPMLMGNTDGQRNKRNYFILNHFKMAKSMFSLLFFLLVLEVGVGGQFMVCIMASKNVCLLGFDP
jgi:hypothetical protein